VGGKIDGAIYVDREISIDLDEADAVSFVPIVAAPRFAIHIFKSKSLCRREVDHTTCSLPAFANCRLENILQFV
jgi:hypothetical protein